MEYHLEVEGRSTVDHGHAIGHATESAVERLLPGIVGVTAHVEPVGIDDERLYDRVREPFTA
jgi:ferrous-iron efflux pump FieF